MVVTTGAADNRSTAAAGRGSALARATVRTPLLPPGPPPPPSATAETGALMAVAVRAAEAGHMAMKTADVARETTATVAEAGRATPAYLAARRGA